MFEELFSLIQAHDTIILHRHHHPDGDAIGSQVGLKCLIADRFPQKKVYMVGDAAGRYGFIDGSQMDEVPDSAYTGALAIILDASARHLISDARYALASATVRVDHHLFCEKIADTEICDTRYESCCGLIAAFAKEQRLTVSTQAATALYTGMVTDSGRFRYDATSAQTFRLASFLMESGIDLNAVYHSLYADDFASVQLRARYVLKIAFTERKVAYIYTTKEELAASGADVFAISRGMVSTMADIKGVDKWVNFTETESGVLCELRSSRCNINPIAVKYGGGGHQKASGATVADRAAAMQMLRDLDAMMEEQA